MIETLDIFDFSLGWMFFNGFCSAVGFMGWEFWQYKKDEESYSKENKKGDYLFGFIFIPFVFTFCAPYAWIYFEHETFYNPATSTALGTLFDFVMLYAIKKAKKETDEV